MYLFFTNCCQKCHILSESLMLMCLILFRSFGWLVLVGLKLVVSVLFLSLEKMRRFRSWVLSDRCKAVAKMLVATSVV